MDECADLLQFLETEAAKRFIYRDSRDVYLELKFRKTSKPGAAPPRGPTLIQTKTFNILFKNVLFVCFRIISIMKLQDEHVMKL